jgi:lysyl-tRNA synthetase class 2
VAADRVRVRRVRRLAAGAIFLAGLFDLLVAVSRPAAGHLHLVREYLPLGVAQAAGALVALAGIGLMMLARGMLRGQRRSWTVAVGLLAATLVLHVVHGASLGGLLLTALVLLLLLAERDLFGAAADQASLRSAVLTLVVGGVVAVGAATLAIEVSGRVRHHPLPSWPVVLGAATERLVGLHTVVLPDSIDDWISPSLLAVGVGLALVALYLLTRPVVDRRLSSGGASAAKTGPGRASSGRTVSARRAAEIRARDIVRRHGTGTLDYFALRDDKHWFFHRDSLVAYAVYGGVCLVSPDPIGPHGERHHVWDGFRRYCDRNGWGVAVMAAAEEWLPLYRDAGMRHLYIGDEAVVDVQQFSLQGGKMKGLRQAVNRVERNGYTVAFLDPAQVSPEVGGPLVDLMSRNRRGEAERGFSMMLGRMFDPRDTGLLLTAVYGPGGEPAAMCQFVPSAAISGFSLDLMRRDPGEHPNGLLDFALCSTIEHLRRRGQQGLSLNFAALRSTLDGESGDGLTQRVERWALRRMSGVLQIESLWRFNAKYEPGWLPRYVVYDSPEQFAPALVSILRAESLSEVPVVGRLLAPSGNRRSGPAVPETITGAGDAGAARRPT